MAYESIGNLVVEITGDYSELQGQLDAAASTAESSANAIAAAFDKPVGAEMESSLASLGTAASDAGSGFTTLATDVEGVGSAAAGAATPIENAGESTRHAGEAASEAGGSLREMAEQFVAIGEALVITEGLVEFGDEALTAADNITRANIALGTLSGSAEQAKGTIEHLEELGISDGLAFPSLLKAATNMTAILQPGTDVVGLLGHIADGAAVMGTDITAAATRFDQMATAGTASARTLTQIGLSLDSLSEAFNRVIAGSDTTARSVGEAFKALDQSQRVQVLTDALQHLGGTAQQVAQQTFGGQWIILSNQWEQVMAKVGETLIPVISALTDFAKTDVIPFISAMVDDFKALPVPVQDVAVGVALAAAALVPLAGGLAATGLAMAGLQTVLPLVTGLLGTFGIASGEAAVAEEGLAAASTEVAAAGALPAVAGALTLVGEAAIAAAAAFAGFKLGDWLDHNLPAFDRFTTGINELINDIPGFTDFINHISGLQGATNGLDQSTEKLKEYAASIGIVLTGTYTSVEQYSDALIAAIKAQDGTAASMKDLMGAAATAFDNLEASQSKEKQAADNLKQVYEAIRDALQDGTNKVNGHTVSTKDLTVAYNEWITASEKVNVYLKGFPDSLSAITGAQQKATDEYKRATDALKILADQSAHGKDVDDLLVVAQNNLNDAWTKAHPALDQLNKDLEKNSNLANLSGMDKIIAEQGKATQAWQQAIDTYNQLTQAFQRGEVTQADVARGAQALETAFKAANPQLQTAATHATNLGGGLTAADTGIRTFTAGADGFNTSLTNGVNPAMLKFNTGLETAGQVSVDAGGKLNTVLVPGVKDATAATEGFVQSSSDAAKVVPSFTVSAADLGVKIQTAGVDVKKTAEEVGTFLDKATAGQMVIKGFGEAANQGFRTAWDGARAMSQGASGDIDGLVDHLKNGTTVIEGFGHAFESSALDIDKFIKLLPNGTTEILSLTDALNGAAAAAQAATDKILRMEDAESITGSSFGSGGDITGSSSAASMFENLASVAFGTQNFGIGGTPSDNDLVSAAAAAGLIWLGGRNFVTLDEYNAMLGASGYHASGVNPNGSAIFDQTPKNSSGGSGPASSSSSSSSSSSTNASAQVSASGTADINSSLSQLGTSSTTAASGTTALTTATTAAASTITQASQQIAQASTAVALAGSTAAVVAQAIVQAVSPGVLGSNSRIDMPGAPAVPVSPIALGSNAPVGPTNYSTSGVGSGLQLTVNVSGNTVNGTQGMQDLSNRVADSIVTKLRAVAGLKL